jgi:hypothetical protein
MRTRGPAVTADVLERLRDAQNRHDLDSFVDCFDPAYRSEQPVHPDRAFTGREQVRRNWAAVFDGVPDFQAELLGSAQAGDAHWAEWYWHGTRATPELTRHPAFPGTVTAADRVHYAARSCSVPGRIGELSDGVGIIRS